MYISIYIHIYIYIYIYIYVKASQQHEVRYRSHEPRDAFEVHFANIFLMKAKHVSDETSSIVSCIMRKQNEIMQ